MSDKKFAFFAEGNTFSNVDSSGSVKFWRKQILKLGKWKHPQDSKIEFEVTTEVTNQILTNFLKGHPTESPIVMTHSDDPRLKVGRVRAFIPTAEGLDAVFSIDDVELNKNIDSKEKAPGVSCWLDLAAKDKQSGDVLGAVVKHVAIVNHPYMEGMQAFQPAALSDGAENFEPLVLSENKEGGVIKMTKEELIAALKTEHGIDVTVLLSSATDLKTLQDRIVNGEYVEASRIIKLSDENIALLKTLKLSDEDIADVNKIVAFVNDKLKTAEGFSKTKEQELSDMKANTAFDVLLSEHLVVPAEKETWVGVFKSDEVLFNKMKEGRKAFQIELSEKGVSHTEDKYEKEKADKQAEIDRLSKLGK